MSAPGVERPLVIVGAGGHGREAFCSLHAQGRAVLGFVDDKAPDAATLERLGARYLGTIDEAADLECDYVIAIGDPQVKAAVAGRFDAPNHTPTSSVHPSTVVGLDVEWAPGLLAAPGASLTTNVRLGRHVHVNVNATVGHDSQIGDFVSIHPGANVGGNVTIGARTMIGTGACVIQGVTIGADVTVGAGAAVVRDVPDGATVVGVPAKPR